MSRQINVCWDQGCIIDLQWPSVPSRSITPAISNTRTSSVSSFLLSHTKSRASTCTTTPPHTYVPRVNYSQARATPCYTVADRPSECTRVAMGNEKLPSNSHTPLPSSLASLTHFRRVTSKTQFRRFAANCFHFDAIQRLDFKWTLKSLCL